MLFKVKKHEDIQKRINMKKANKRVNETHRIFNCSLELMAGEYGYRSR